MNKVLFVVRVSADAAAAVARRGDLNGGHVEDQGRAYAVSGILVRVRLRWHSEKTNTLSRVHVKLVVRPDMSERRRRADIRGGVFFSRRAFLIRSF